MLGKKQGWPWTYQLRGPYLSPSGGYTSGYDRDPVFKPCAQSKALKTTMALMLPQEAPKDLAAAGLPGCPLCRRNGPRRCLHPYSWNTSEDFAILKSVPYIVTRLIFLKHCFHSVTPLLMNFKWSHFVCRLKFGVSSPILKVLS